MKNTLRPLALATELGVTMVFMTFATVGIGLALGLWLDRVLGIRPVATILGVLLGALVGLLGTVNLAQSAARQLNSASAQHQEVRFAYTARALGRALLLILLLIVATLMPVFLGLVLGLVVDRALATRPAFTIVLTVIGAILAIVAVYLIAVRASRSTGQGS